MKCSGNKRLLIPLCLVLWGAFLAFGCHKKEYTERHLEAGKISGLRSLLNAHESSVPYLKVDGEVFKRVRGDPPYFLRVSGQNVILFVTRTEDERQSVLRLADLDRHKIIDVDLGDSIFGTGIQPSAKPGEFCDWIQSYTPEELIVTTKNTYGQIVTTIDLSLKTVRRVEKIPAHQGKK